MNDDIKTVRKSKTAPETASEPTDSVAFRTPEQVAAADDLKADSPTPDTPSDTDLSAVPVAAPSRGRLAALWADHKKPVIVTGCVIIILLAALIGWLLARQPSQTVLTNVKPAVQAAPKIATPLTVPSALSGLPVVPAVNSRPVTGVMVENSDDARPQSGLSQAEVVFEAVAEGGITRFLALYQDTQPDNVGPIRSVRPYYLQWAMGFDAAVAHVGGSPDALSDISTWGVRDLDQFYNGSYYHRISSREAPHNVYTAITTLNQLEDTKGYTSSTFTSWPRKADAPLKVPTAATINLTLSSSDYNVAYSYDAHTNTYNRDEGGAPMIDANTNTQISPKVVIAIVVPETQGTLDASGAYYSDYTVLGTGTAYIFQDGGITIGQWTKASNTTQITFTTPKGAPIKLDAGQTWITAITSSSNVSYQP